MSFSKLLSALTLIACLFMMGNSAFGQSKALKKVRVGVPSVGMGNIIPYVTREAKLFEKYGLDAEVISVMGSGIGSKALISGNIDIIPIATPTVKSPRPRSRRARRSSSCATTAAPPKATPPSPSTGKPSPTT